MLLAEELLLLIVRKPAGRTPPLSGTPAVLAAVLVELAETVMRTGFGLYPALVRRMTEHGTLVRGTRLGFPAWR
jgi:hypothetical protein